MLQGLSEAPFEHGASHAKTVVVWQGYVTEVCLCKVYS